jgi:hypothetical protein
MPFRHWYAVFTVEGQEYRIGPYATRLMAQRKASEVFKGAASADVTITYEGSPSPVRNRRGRH